MPAEHCRCGIGHGGDTLASGLYQSAQIGEERSLIHPR
jgi:hypothetical protein